MPSVPWLAGLFAAATLVTWLRKRSWAERMRGPSLYAAVGAGAGVFALAVAVIAGTPLVEWFTQDAVQWSMYPIVRGSVTAFITVAILVAAGTLAAELLFRGFIVELGREFTRNNWVGVLVGALVEALLADGDAGMKLGAGIFGLGLGAMYIASGRSVVASLCARLTFALGALVLEALRVVG